MKELSLITATRGRIPELERLLLSLQAQFFQGLELILVDQTPGDEMDGLIDRFSTELDVQRIRIAPCGISHARNEGLRHVTGRIIAFPDDDCAYPPGLLKQIFQCLEKQPEVDGVSCFVCDEQGASSAGGVMKRAGCEMSFSNVWKTAVSCSFFVRREVAERIGDFDEQLGVGAESDCWSGEETDWLLRALKQGARIFYRPDISILHPQPDFRQPEGIHKAFRYGCGAGRVLRKHHYPFWFIAASIGFQLLRAVGELFRFRPRMAGVRLAMAAGRLQRVSSVYRELDIVLISSCCWHGDGPLNAHHLARRLAKDHRVLFVESVGLRQPSLSVGSDRKKIVARVFNQGQRLFFKPRRVEPNLYISSPVVFPFWGSAGIRSLNRRWFRHQVQAATRQLGFKHPLLWAMMPYADALIERSPDYCGVIYNKVDRYEHNPGVDSSLLLEQEQRLVDAADVCVGSSHVLADDLSRYGKPTKCWPNVAEVERFASPQPVPCDLAPLKARGAVALYAGNIASYKVDASWLSALADASPDVILLLIGPQGLGEDGSPDSSIECMLALDNVLSLGVRPHDQLPGYMQHADVGLIPFVHSRLTDASLPLKTFEYLAAGLPVVASSIESLRRLGTIDGLALTDSSDEFVAAVSRALDHRPPADSLRRAADSFSWRERQKQIDQLVGRFLPCDLKKEDLKNDETDVV